MFKTLIYYIIFEIYVQMLGFGLKYWNKAYIQILKIFSILIIKTSANYTFIIISRQHKLLPISKFMLESYKIGKAKRI